MAFFLSALLLLFLSPLLRCKAPSCPEVFACHCDPQCRSWGDCCTGPGRLAPFLTCWSARRLWPNANSSGCPEKHVLLVQSCPASFPDAQLRSQCESEMQIQPFFGDSLLFKNRFCGLCHGASELKVCSRAELCSPLRSCDPEEISSCPEQPFCDGGPVRRVRCGSRLFRNLACAKCRGFKPFQCAPAALPPSCLVNQTFTTEVPLYWSEHDFRQQVFLSTLSGLSIAALLVLLVVYARGRPFHNFAGALTVTLAISQILTSTIQIPVFFAARGTPICRIVGALFAFAILSNFAWMSVMGQDLLRLFRRTSSVRSSGAVGRYLRYSAFGWGIPTFLVCGSAILDVFAPKLEISPNYGLPFCFINQLGAFLMWLYLPIGLIVCFNFAIMLNLFRVFCRLAHDTRHVRTHVRRNMFLLCVKVTVLLSLCSALQFISVFVENDILHFINHSLAAARGVGIAMVFLASSQTRKTFQGNNSSASGQFQHSVDRGTHSIDHRLHSLDRGLLHSVSKRSDSGEKGLFHSVGQSLDSYDRKALRSADKGARWHSVERCSASMDQLANSFDRRLLPSETHRTPSMDRVSHSMDHLSHCVDRQPLN